MAKKSGTFSFSNLGDLIQDSIKKTSILVEDPKNPASSDCIGTGIYMLNALFSKSILFGGVLSNRITVLAGESGVGKSYLCYNIAREAQKAGYGIIYIDTEFSIQLHELTKFGIDITEEKFKLIRSNVVEDLKIFLAKLVLGLKEAKEKGQDIEKFVIFLDSIGQLASRKEVSDAQEGKEKADMTRAKAIGSMFRIINADLGYLNVPLVATNHTYMTTDMFPQEILKGGRSIYYSASTIVFLSKAKLKDGEEDELDLGQSGIVVTAKSKKNRLARPKKIKFEISFNHGSNPYKGLEMFCRPETFDTVGIAKGKMEVDKSTGEETFKPGGNKWYVKHLGKSVWEKDLFTKRVFTDEVLQALEPIIAKYFEYSSYEEIQQENADFEELDKEMEENAELQFTDLDDLEDLM